MTADYGIKKNNPGKDLASVLQNKATGRVANSKSIVQQAAPVSGWTAYKAYLKT